mmetsp:Transcript_96408/g.261855  ORF Transcript_96408/g.261855 Transcript_96408/m.261855 type:complete len:413 (+) Transcript_96408:28-1266(+)
MLKASRPQKGMAPSMQLQYIQHEPSRPPGRKKGGGLPACDAGSPASPEKAVLSSGALPLGPPLQVLHDLPCLGVDEAVRVDGAPAGVRVGEHGQTLEAPPGVAVPAEHLVALDTLLRLLLQIFLGCHHVTCRALLRARLLDPPLKHVLVLEPSLVLLASAPLVVGLCPAEQARLLLAHGAGLPVGGAVVEAPRAVRGGARACARRDGLLLSGTGVEANADLWRQQGDQVCLRDLVAATRARDAAGAAGLQARLDKPPDALLAIPPVVAAESDRLACRKLLAADAARLALQAEAHEPLPHHPLLVLPELAVGPLGVFLAAGRLVAPRRERVGEAAELLRPQLARRGHVSDGLLAPRHLLFDVGEQETLGLASGGELLFHTVDHLHVAFHPPPPLQDEPQRVDQVLLDTCILQP